MDGNVESKKLEKSLSSASPVNLQRSHDRGCVDVALPLIVASALGCGEVIKKKGNIIKFCELKSHTISYGKRANMN